MLMEYHILAKDVAYVILTESYWMPFDKFMALRHVPRVWRELSLGYFGDWEIPHEFRIVMKDNRWIDYRAFDGSYGTFMLHIPSRKPTREYVEWVNDEPKPQTFTNKHLTLADFNIKLHNKGALTNSSHLFTDVVSSLNGSFS